MPKWPNTYNLNFNKTLKSGEIETIERYLDDHVPGWNPETLKKAIAKIAETSVENKPPLYVIANSIRGFINEADTNDIPNCAYCEGYSKRLNKRVSIGIVTLSLGDSKTSFPCVCGAGVNAMQSFSPWCDFTNEKKREMYEYVKERLTKGEI